MSKATDAQRASEERELRIARALDDLRDAVRDVLDEADEKLPGTVPISALTYDPRRFFDRIREIVERDPTEERYAFGSKDQLRSFTARTYGRLDDARKRYIDELRAIVAEELDIEFPKEGT